jgi:ribonuclease Z
MKVTILGNNSALPAYGRHPTAQAVSVAGELVLIDCGEGTQVQMNRYGVRWRKVHHIFISHLHGDHYFGLPGLINTMGLMGRTESLHIYAPAPLEGIIKVILDVADTVLPYPLHFYPIPAEGGLLFENQSFTLRSFPVNHRIDCWGLVIATKPRLRRVLPRQCESFSIPYSYYEALKDGADYTTPEGTIVPNDAVTELGRPSKSYAYCADTLFTDAFLPMIQGVDLLYHESTYLDEDAEKAKARYHTTASQAATIAAQAGVKRLLLGHFSSKYRELRGFGEQASLIFPNVAITEEGETYEA